MVWLTERGVFALLRLDTDYFAAMYSYTITFGPVTLRTSDPSDQCPFGPVTCNLQMVVELVHWSHTADKWQTRHVFVLLVLL